MHRLISLGMYWTLTFTPGEGVAPLPIGLAARFYSPLQNVSGVADKAHSVIQVELGSLGRSESRVARVTTCDGWGSKRKQTNEGKSHIKHEINKPWNAIGNVTTKQSCADTSLNVDAE